MNRIFKTLCDQFDNLLNWLSKLFDVDLNDRPKQLIPVRHDQNKPARNINQNNYEEKLLKLALLVVTLLLLALTGVNIAFDH